MSGEARVLTDLAASVADGAAIDWQKEESSLHPSDQRLVRHLHLVASVAELYRSLPPDEQPPPDGATEGQETRWGPLVLLESLGKGTTAEVYRAWDATLQREIALKLFPPDEGQHAHDRVLSEARRLARVRHPNVATVYGAERHGNQVGFWMELVRGSSLDEILKQQGPFGAREAALVGSEIASALAAVHRAGLLHRDIKAQNVLREEGGRIVLADFGTGEELNAPAPVRMAGTPMYLAPEVLRGQAASVESDIYSLGVLLFLLTTGTFPIRATTMMELARGHAEGRQRLRDVRPDLPFELAEVIETALAVSPSDRFRTAGAFEEALRKAVDPRLQATGMAPRSTNWTRLVLYAVFVLLTVVLAMLPWRRDTASPGAAQRLESLAVLPLVDTTGANPQLAEAMTDQLIATLGQIQALKVTSRSSVLPFRDRTSAPTEVARRLGVNAVLQGTIAAEESAGLGRRIRVTARLLAAGTGAELWSGSFDAAPGEIAEMETSLAKSIAHGIRLAVSPREADRLRTGGARTSPQAEEAYFQGRYQLMQYGVDSARRALVAFERAISIDPRHAAAHAALARTYVTLGFNGALSQPEARARALAVSSRAMELDSESSEVQLALADLAFYYDWDWKRADAFYKRAIELGPSAAYARSQYARYLAAAGRVKEAIDQAVQAEALDPLSPDAAQTEGLMRYYARDYGGAERALQHAIEIDPAYARAHYVLGRVREAQGRVTDAVTVTDHAFSLSREPGSNWLAQLSRLHALAGEHALARREVEDLARGALRSHPENLAYTYLALGEPGRAMALLEQAAAERDPSLLWLRVDPRVDPLRGTPRFDALLKRLGTP